MPQADGTLVAVPGGLDGVDDALLPALLALTDVPATGLHGAVLAGVGEGSTVAVIGDGAVGLCAVLGARQLLGAERVDADEPARGPGRASAGRSAPPTSSPSAARRASPRCASSPAAAACAHVVEAVGTPESWDMAIGMARAGGRVGAVGVPHTSPELPLFPIVPPAPDGRHGGRPGAPVPARPRRAGDGRHGSTRARCST